MALTFVLGGSGPEAVSASIASDGYALDEDNEYTPNDTTAEIWIKGDTIWGNGNGLQYTQTDDCGDDNGAGTQADPIMSIRELDRRLRNGFGQGMHVKVYCMGSGGPDFDSPTEGRILWTRSLRFSHGNGSPECFRSNITYICPRKMLALSSPLTLVSATDVTNGSHRIGRTKLTFNGPMTAATYHIRWCRANGREVIAPFAVEENDVDGVSVYTSIMAAASFSSYLQAGDTFTAVMGAVCFESDDGDTQFRGVHLLGEVAHRIGNRESAEEPTHDRNPWSHVERGCFGGRTVIGVKGHLRIETCNFRDDVTVDHSASVRSMGSVVEGYLHYNGHGVHRTASSQYDAREEPACRLTEYNPALAFTTQSNTGACNPDVPIIGQDWCVTGQGAGVIVGTDIGSTPASLRILKGLSVNAKQGSAVGVKVYSGSRFYAANLARICLTMLNSSCTGFWAVDGGGMRINDGPVDIGGGTIADAGSFAGPCVYGTSNHVKVGKTAAVALGTGVGALREVAGLNGVIVSTYDYSRAWVPSTEPTSYGEAVT